MTRIFLTVLALGLFGLGLTGCHADADVNPHGQSSVNVSR